MVDENRDPDTPGVQTVPDLRHQARAGHGAVLVAELISGVQPEVPGVGRPGSPVQLARIRA